MNQNKLTLIFILVMCLMLASPKLMFSQMNMGQYEDEAPLQSWNTFGLQTAPSLGRGGAGFTLSVDSSCSLLNPALLTRLPKLSVTISGAYNAASMFRYAILNTGVFTTTQNQSFGIYSGDYIGLSAKIKGWSLSLSVSNLESFRRPELVWNYTYEGQLYYTIHFDQTGLMLNTNFSLAKKISDRLSAGLGLNFVRAKQERLIEEQWIVSNRSITDSRTLRLNGFYLNGGIVWDFSDKMTLAAVFRTPYARKGDSESLYRFQASQGNTDIQIDGEGESSFLQPTVFGIGMHYDIFEDLLFTADASFFNWSSYEVELFGEALQRDFKNIVKINAGFELISEFTLFNLKINSPFRFGFIYDPQPMKTPDSYYMGFALGSGIYFRNFIVDFAYFTGKENGSGHKLAVKKILFTISFQMGRTE